MITLFDVEYKIDFRFLHLVVIMMLELRTILILLPGFQGTWQVANC